jgi:Family of unknown function (DUF5996)
MHDDAVWPALPADAWADTRDTVHMWTQIVGKVRMATTPMINHWWNVTLYVSYRGLTTSPMPHGDRTFQIDFDFEDHRLDIDTADGERRSMKLEPRSVADFYNELMAQLDELGLSTPIWTMPVEVEGAIPFDQDDEHASYDAQAANRFWRVLVQSDRVLRKFRAGFVGKVSPVHFFWGGFDLAVTRFSGRAAPPHTLQPPHCGPHVMREAYSHEVSSAGYWPAAGGAEGAFYSYAYPVPDGFADASVRPAAASFNEELGEFVLPYETVRAVDDPDDVLLEFLQTTYEAAADTAGWDRPALEATGGQLPGFSAAERTRTRR